MSKQDDLARVIADNLNKAGSDKIAFFLDSEEASTHLTDFISTGSSILDLAIANRPHGGIACGRITELQGNEGSGKSLVAAHALADTQKRGGVAVLIDTETALNYDFFEAVGLDFSKMVYVSENKLENIFNSVEQIIETVRKSSKKKLVTIVIDSVSGATTEDEAEEEHGRTGYATGKAIIISKALRKITKLIGDQKVALILTNQLRHKMGAMPFSDPYTTSGGKALAFHASTRIRFANAGTLKDSNKETVGVKLRAKVIKNRLGPPYREAMFMCYFDRGIDDYASWYEVLKDRKIIKTSGAWATWTDPDTKENIKFQKATFEKILLEGADRREIIYNQLCEALIMTYADRESIEIVDEAPETM
jgi:recombination protein RecA